jgi:quercetin 2,3-dioxygenase
LDCSNKKALESDGPKGDNLAVIESRSGRAFITKRPAEARGESNLAWLYSRHTFSFGDYFDPDKMGFRALRVINEDIVEAGKGFESHLHEDVEIFSYVISGELQHKDSMGNGSIIKAGNLQYISAGRGMSHSEFNPSKSKRVHFLQIWLMPNEHGGHPHYSERTLGRETRPNALTLLFADKPHEGATGIRADADIHFGKLDAGRSIALPIKASSAQWVHTISGQVSVMGERLRAGDGASIENANELEIQSRSDAHFLLFDLKSESQTKF